MLFKIKQRLTMLIKPMLFTALLSTGLLYAQANDAPLSQKQQQALTPDAVLANMMAGNKRFVSGKTLQRNITVRIAESAAGQYPKAVVLSCMDSRVPVEKVFDVSIGDIFVGRVAGNVISPDQLGSMEYATKLAGAKIVFVLGHTECGAVKGAISGAKLGNLTGLLAKIEPAVKDVKGFKPDERTASDSKFVDAVAAQNVRDTIASIRHDSPILAKLEKEGKIRIVGGMYDVHTGKVTLIN
jgi:carbonic anhydrase